MGPGGTETSIHTLRMHHEQFLILANFSSEENEHILTIVEQNLDQSSALHCRLLDFYLILLTLSILYSHYYNILFLNEALKDFCDLILWHTLLIPELGKVDLYEFKVSLAYIVFSRPARFIQQDPVSQNKHTNTPLLLLVHSWSLLDIV